MTRRNSAPEKLRDYSLSNLKTSLINLFGFHTFETYLFEQKIYSIYIDFTVKVMFSLL